MITWLLSQVPLWVYVAVFGLGAGAMFYFLSPIIVPLWAASPRWVKWALGGFGAVAVAYIAGMTAAGKAARERQKEKERVAVQRREEIHRDVEKRDGTTIDRDFDKWVR